MRYVWHLIEPSWYEHFLIAYTVFIGHYLYRLFCNDPALYWTGGLVCMGFGLWKIMALVALILRNERHWPPVPDAAKP